MKINHNIAKSPKDLEQLEFKKMKAIIKKDLKRLEKYTTAEKPTPLMLVAEHDYKDKKKMAFILFGKWQGTFKKYAKEEIGKKNPLGAIGLAYYGGIGTDGQKNVILKLAKGKGKKKTDKMERTLKKLLPQATHNVIFQDLSEKDFDAMEQRLENQVDENENNEDLNPDLTDEGQVEVGSDQRHSKLLTSNSKEISKGAKWIKTEAGPRIKNKNPLEGDSDMVIDIADLLDEWFELYREAPFITKAVFILHLAKMKTLHKQVRVIFNALIALGVNPSNGRMLSDTTVDDLSDTVENTIGNRVENSEKVDEEEVENVSNASDPRLFGLEKAVGKKQANQEKDVLVIQKLLNKNGANPLLTEDSDYGSKTETAILAVQTRLGFKKPDAIISPNKKTHKALLEGKIPKINLSRRPATADKNTSGRGASTTPVVLEEMGNINPPSKSTNVLDAKNASKVDSSGKLEEFYPIRNGVGLGGYNSPNDVITVQRLLKLKKYDVDLDGDCNEKTITAIKAFQKKIGLKKPDGLIGFGKRTYHGTTWQKLSGNPKGKPNSAGTLLWKTHRDAFIITSDQKVIDNIKDKYHTNPNSPKSLPERAIVEQGPDGGYLLGVSEVERPKETTASLNTNYGKVDGTKIGEAAHRAAFAKANIINITVPFPMINVYTGKTSNKIRVNKAVANTLKAVFNDILAFYGDPAIIQELGLNRYGGCFVFRTIRGGTRPSTHAWGVAVDMCPRLNPLKHPDTKKTSGLNNHSLFAEDQYKAMLRIFEKHGWYNLGECKDYDYMHFQAAIPSSLKAKRPQS